MQEKSDEVFCNWQAGIRIIKTQKRLAKKHSSSYLGIMPQKTFTQLGLNRVVAQITVEESALYGIGEHWNPRIGFQVKLEMHGHDNGNDLEFEELRAEIKIDETRQIRISTPIARPIDIVIPIEAGHSFHSYPVFEFPVSLAILSQLEQWRNGGDLTLMLEFNLKVREFGEPLGSSGRWTIRCIQNINANFSLKIPRSAWIENVLNKTGYGKVHIMELPAIPLERWKGLEGAFAALQQAQRLCLAGEYDDAVGKCRVAMEPLWERYEGTDPNGDKIKLNRLKTSWQARLGTATYKWLNESLLGMRRETNSPHHSPLARFSQLEAHLIISIVTSLIAYAARTGE